MVRLVWFPGCMDWEHIWEMRANTDICRARSFAQCTLALGYCQCDHQNYLLFCSLLWRERRVPVHLGPIGLCGTQSKTGMLGHVNPVEANHLHHRKAPVTLCVSTGNWSMPTTSYTLISTPALIWIIQTLVRWQREGYAYTCRKDQWRSSR